MSTILNGNVETATPNATGVVSENAISQITSKRFLDENYLFSLREINKDAASLSTTEIPPYPLSHTEAVGILASGLALLPMYTPRRLEEFIDDWSKVAGTEQGINAVEILKTIGIPLGVCVWLDQYLVSDITKDDHPNTAKNNFSDYTENWVKEVLRGGYVAGYYEGNYPAGNSTTPTPNCKDRGVLQLTNCGGSSSSQNQNYKTITIGENSDSSCPIQWLKGE
ncbi:MAG: hypothetical protein COA42_19145 [Alteromonadaceae bacterium]|nr:MAG: hypothetical protein COA42_19145 [Alteromonadaceae bacterium]